MMSTNEKPETKLTEVSIPEEFKSRLTPGSEGAEVIYWKFESNMLIKEVR